ncbi:hypothetical protein HpHA98_01390 [Helicobacter pylori]
MSYFESVNLNIVTLLKGERNINQPTHSIMSYFESVNLNIVTLLKGERNINQPTHKNFKPLDEPILIKAIKLIENELKVYL